MAILFVLCLYFIVSQTSIIFYLFNTLLGNFLLLSMVLGVGTINCKWAFGLASFFVILNHSFRKTEN